MQRGEVGDASVFQALAGHAAQLALDHVEPTAVLGGVDEVDSPHAVVGLLGRERCVERPVAAGDRGQAE